MSVENEYLCAASGELLYMPVVTTDGVAYSYLSLFDMFMEAQGSPTCVVKYEPIEYFPHVCLALHHFLGQAYPAMYKARGKDDETELMSKFGLRMPNVSSKPDDDGPDGFREEMSCVVSGELAYRPCALSSGNIVSEHNIPEGGFVKDPDRLIACALHNQVPKRSPTLEMMIRDQFNKEYAHNAVPVQKVQGTQKARDPQEYLHLGFGCDGCGQWPIRGTAWYDVETKDPVGFHLCGACYQFGYHRRVLTGRFDQAHRPKAKMLEMPRGDMI